MPAGLAGGCIWLAGWLAAGKGRGAPRWGATLPLPVRDPRCVGKVCNHLLECLSGISGGVEKGREGEKEGLRKNAQNPQKSRKVPKKPPVVGARWNESRGQLADEPTAKGGVPTKSSLLGNGHIFPRKCTYSPCHLDGLFPGFDRVPGTLPWPHGGLQNHETPVPG